MEIRGDLPTGFNIYFRTQILFYSCGSNYWSVLLASKIEVVVKEEKISNPSSFASGT